MVVVVVRPYDDPLVTLCGFMNRAAPSAGATVCCSRPRIGIREAATPGVWAGDSGRVRGMPGTTPLDEAQMNDLWLHSEHAILLARSADQAARTVDELARAVLSAGSDPDEIAAAAFIDIDLIEHIRAGGITSEYLRERTGKDRAEP